MNKKSPTSAYRLTEKLLLVVAAAAILFTVGYVYSANQITTATLEATDKDAQTTPVHGAAQLKRPLTTTANPSSVGQTYTAPGGEFSLKLADGWKLSRYQRTGSLYTFSDDDLTPRPGQPAAVTQVAGGKDGTAEGLFISFSNGDAAVPEGKKVKMFSTEAGDPVQVYSHVETGQTEAIGMLAKGGTYYTYIIDKAANKHMSFAYGFNVGQVDNHLVVESVIRSLQIR